MEMKKVRIHVKSYEKNNNEKAAIETVSFGRMAEKNGKFYVFYDETEAVGMQGTKTTIKWNYDNVVLSAAARWNRARNLPRGWSV